MPETNPQTSRRTVLAAGATAIAGAGALAACSSESNNGSATTSTGGSASAGGVIVAVSDVPVGGAVVKEVNGQPVVIAQPEAGKILGMNGRCTHQGCAVQVLNASLVCPCHNSKFNIGTGAVEQGPATTPLSSVPLAISGENVVTA